MLYPPRSGKVMNRQHGHANGETVPAGAVGGASPVRGMSSPSEVRDALPRRHTVPNRIPATREQGACSCTGAIGTQPLPTPSAVVDLDLWTAGTASPVEGNRRPRGYV